MADLNYNHLRYFRAVAHEGNLTRAAALLNLSQSAISVQIKTLETRLGHALFERRGRQLVLTEAGRIALEHADAIFQTGADLLGILASGGQTGANGVSEPARRALRVGALSTLSRNFQLSFLHPVIGREDVEVVLRSGSQGELLAQLEDLGLDVVLTGQSLPRDAASRFVSHLIDTQPVALIGTPARIGAGGGLAQMLTAHPLILPTVETPLRADFDALVDRMDLRLNIAAEVDDVAMMRLLARADAGLAVLPPIAVQDELANGTLQHAADLGPLKERFYAVTRSRRFPNPLLRTLLPKGESEA